MADAKVVMEVRVLWLAEGSDEDIERYLTALDSGPFPGPSSWVATGLDFGAQRLNIDDPGHDGRAAFQVVVEGPDRWLPDKQLEN